MSDIDQLLSQIPITDIAAQLGVEPDEADAAVQQAIPALLHGLQTTADSGDGSTADLQAALDGDDADRMVASLFGEKTDDVATALSDQVPAAAVDQGLIKKLLPILAPIVLSFVLKKLSGNTADGQSNQGGGGLGDILGGALGGSGGGALGSILGGLLGGSVSGSGGSTGTGGLGSILGDLLGGR